MSSEQEKLSNTNNIKYIKYSLYDDNIVRTCVYTNINGSMNIDDRCNINSSGMYIYNKVCATLLYNK